MTTSDLLREWNDEQFQKVEDAIASYYQTPISQISSILGLAYTSSGVFAALWVCSKYDYLKENPKYCIRGFALSRNNQVVAYCENSEGDELLHIIS